MEIMSSKMERKSGSQALPAAAGVFGGGVQRVIAAVREDADLEAALVCGAETVFLLSGDLRSLESQCARLHERGKQTFLHFDLVNGLKGDLAGITYAAEHFHLTGIISTKAPCLKIAHDCGLQAILRVFVLDSSAFRTGLHHVQSGRPDYVEVLPGVSGKIIRMATAEFQLPIIAGGLIQSREDVADALAAGAAAVSTSRHELWPTA